MGFLQRFGYLESQGSNSEALFSEDAITNAIRTMQTYGGIYPTGKMDNDTLKVPYIRMRPLTVSFSLKESCFFVIFFL